MGVENLISKIQESGGTDVLSGGVRDNILGPLVLGGYLFSFAGPTDVMVA